MNLTSSLIAIAVLVTASTASASESCTVLTLQTQSLRPLGAILLQCRAYDLARLMHLHNGAY